MWEAPTITEIVTKLLYEGLEGIFNYVILILIKCPFVWYVTRKSSGSGRNSRPGLGPVPAGPGSGRIRKFRFRCTPRYFSESQIVRIQKCFLNPNCFRQYTMWKDRTFEKKSLDHTTNVCRSFFVKIWTLPSI